MSREKVQLTRENIAAAALRIADKDGFEAVSMRRIARELKAGTMSLYYYVKTKEDLMAVMDDALMRESLVPSLPKGWKRAMLEIAKRPKGRLNSRFAKVFRTDWKDGQAFYHPFDRVAVEGHDKWPTEQPSLIWDVNHTIVDYLEEIHSLLNSGDYIGL